MAPNWRGTEAPQPGRAKSWRRPHGTAGAGPKLGSRGLRRFIGVASTLVGTAAMITFVCLVFLPGCTRTDFAVLSMAPYQDEGMPPEPFAQQDVSAFQTQLKARPLPPHLDKPEARPATAAALQPGGAFGKRVVVVYVTALAARSGKGVRLYAPDAQPDESDGDAFNALCERLKELDPETTKLLIIDLARGSIDWRWGQLLRPLSGTGENATDPPPELAAALQSIPNLAILVSAAPGETSWTSPTLGGSVFSHHLLRALDGAADADKNRRLTLAEISDYVGRHVTHTVAQTRDLRGQHPLLFTAPGSRTALQAATIVELTTTRRTANLAPPITPVPQDLTELEKLWREKDRWNERAAGQHPAEWQPLLWRRFREHLRRAEAWRLAGQPAGMAPHLKAARAALADLDREEKLRIAPQPSPFVAASLQRRTGAPRGTVSPPLPEELLKTMLKDLGPAELPAEEVNALIKVRAEAERVTWHSYRAAQLWHGSQLAAADQERRQAEDLAFVGGPSERESSTVARRKADTAYAQMAAVTQELQAAVWLQQRLLAELPDLAGWAARRLPVEDLRRDTADSRRSRILNFYSLGIDEQRFLPPSLADQKDWPADLEDSGLQQLDIDLLALFELTRDLGRLIDRELDSSADPAFPPDSAWRSELKSLTAAINDEERGLEALQDRLQRHADGLIGGSGRAPAEAGDGSQSQYAYWQRLWNALQWPDLEADTRRDLFTYLEQSERELQEQADKKALGTYGPGTGGSWSGLDGTWQGLWALQTLSLGVGDTKMHELWVLWKNAVIDPRKQADLLEDLGDRIRGEFQQLANTAQLKVNSASDLPTAYRTLLKAGRAARTLHGYDAVNLAPHLDPVARLRGLDLGALCLVQADRYLEDFWAVRGEREPWYGLAAGECRKTGLGSVSKGSVAALDKAWDSHNARRQELGGARLRLVPITTTLSLGLESQRDLEVSSEFEAAVPRGVASLWIEHEQALAAETKKIRLMPASRQPVTAAAPAALFQVQRVGTPNNPEDCATIPAQPQLLYRGRLFNEREDIILINPCPPSAITWQYRPAPKTGAILVSGVDRRDTLFVLDCSLSMETELAGVETRWTAALATLRGLLKKLRDEAVIEQKPAYRVGLMAFGHRLRLLPNRVGVAVNPRFKNQPNLPANWNLDFELLSKPQPLDEEFYKQLDEQLSELSPWGNTPLLGALRNATREFPQGKSGLIVAISDGEWQDREIRPEAQRLFKENRALSLQLIAYGPEAQGQLLPSFVKASRNAGVGEEQRIRLHAAPKLLDLRRALDNSLAPRKIQVNSTTVQPIRSYELPLNEAGEQLPGEIYQVQLPGVSALRVPIVGGERLEFEIDAEEGKLLHLRPAPKKFVRVRETAGMGISEPTRFGYHEAKYDPVNRKAEFLFSLDREDHRDAGIIERPAEIRIEVTPRDGSSPMQQSWGLAEGKSVPMWRYTFGDWTGPPPTVSAVWKPTRTEPDLQFKLQDLQENQTASLPGWPAGSLSITTEMQAGKLLVSLKAIDEGGSLHPQDLRLEVGQQSIITKSFQPVDCAWQADVFLKDRTVLYRFDIPEGIDTIAITSRQSLDQDARTLEAPLSIDKWDSEL